jgi:hypothetical protein
MSATAAPYGLRPVNLIGGQPYAGSTRLIKIASAYAANIFYGDPVYIHDDGTIRKAVVTTSITTPATSGVTGVFVGCTYTDPNLNIPIYKQYWPTGTVASDAFAYIVDDPDVVMQVQADGTVAQTALGNNIALNSASGDTGTGNSTTSAVYNSAAVTATLPLRIVGFVESTTSTVGDAFTDLLVKWNMPNAVSTSTTSGGATTTTTTALVGGHAYLNPVGF